VIELGGTWRAAIADEGLRRTFAERDVDDSAWAAIEVPGHWRRTPGFADTDGPVLYRRHFDHEGPAAGDRAWLVFDGLFYVGDVWLDGSYLGDTEGYFIRHTFEVTEQLQDAREHVLAVEVTCSRPEDRTAKRNLTGYFQHGADPRWNPGGIWRPVRVEHTGPVRARSLRMLCRDATTERALVALRAELECRPDAVSAAARRTGHRGGDVRPRGGTGAE
jgi:beta-mannosidase